jgi:hypothetical protein
MQSSLGHIPGSTSTKYNQKNLNAHGIAAHDFRSLFTFTEYEKRIFFYDRMKKIFEIEDQLNDVPIESFFNGPHLHKRHGQGQDFIL